ncbi:MAG: hypothetical protein SOH81_07800 [Acetobacter sp.]|jgi:hypothetical protein
MANTTGITSARSRLALIPAAFHGAAPVIQGRVAMLRESMIWLRNCERMAQKNGNFADAEMYARHAQNAGMKIADLAPVVLIREVR